MALFQACLARNGGVDGSLSFKIRSLLWTHPDLAAAGNAAPGSPR
jgi:hypothetical protein